MRIELPFKKPIFPRYSFQLRGPHTAAILVFLTACCRLKRPTPLRQVFLSLRQFPKKSFCSHDLGAKLFYMIPADTSFDEIEVKGALTKLLHGIEASVPCEERVDSVAYEKPDKHVGQRVEDLMIWVTLLIGFPRSKMARNQRRQGDDKLVPMAGPLPKRYSGVVQEPERAKYVFSGSWQ